MTMPQPSRLLAHRLVTAEWRLHLPFAVMVALALASPGEAQVCRFGLMRNPSNAMDTTLRVGETLTYDCFWQNPSLAPDSSRTPVYQDIVVFWLPREDSIRAVKRVVGLPGDTIGMIGGDLIRNGRRVDEPYVRHSKPGSKGDSLALGYMKTWQSPFLAIPATQPYEPDVQNWGPLIIPDSSVAVLGDNRDESYDTRYVGFIPYSSLIGRLIRVWDPKTRQLRLRRD
jgi:signal peptidase I